MCCSHSAECSVGMFCNVCGAPASSFAVGAHGTFCAAAWRSMLNCFALCKVAELFCTKCSKCSKAQLNAELFCTTAFPSSLVGDCNVCMAQKAKPPLYGSRLPKTHTFQVLTFYNKYVQKAFSGYTGTVSALNTTNSVPTIKSEMHMLLV